MNFFRDKNVLVTGATGLVGGHLVDRLIDEGANVTVFVRDWDPRSYLIEFGDIDRCGVVMGKLEEFADVERAINEHEIDTVFHLGAQTIVGTANRSPLSTFESNIRGTYNLLEACRMHSAMVKRIVIASSDKAYGDADKLPYTEEFPAQGRHPYDVSKSCADLITQSYYATYNLPVVVARCGNIYGAGDLNYSRIIPGTIRSVLEEKPPVIRSDGKFTRDYVYVKDAVDAYMTMAECAQRVAGEAFNFGPQQPHSVMEIVQTILKIMGGDELLPIVMNQAENEIRDQYLCSEKAKKVLGWEPQYTLEQGLEETILWYEYVLSEPEMELL